MDPADDDAREDTRWTNPTRPGAPSNGETIIWAPDEEPSSSSGGWLDYVPLAPWMLTGLILLASAAIWIGLFVSFIVWVRGPA